MKLYKSNKSLFIKIILSLLAVVSISLLLKVLTYNSYQDFNSYYYGLQTFFHGGNPYVGSRIGAFLYPPPALLFFLPFTLLPLSLAGKVFALFSLGCIFVTIYLLFKIFKIQPLSILGLSFIILICNFFPLKFTLGMGQINNIILLLLTFFILYYQKKREYLAGIFLGVAIAVKLFPILIVMYLIFDRRWKILLSFIVTLVATAILVIMFIKPSINLFFLQTALPNLVNSWKADYYNQAFSGFLMREVSNIYLREVLWNFVAILLVILSFLIIWKVKKTAQTRLLSISMLLTLSLIINSFSWQHHFVWLILPFFITYFVISERKLKIKYYIILVVSYLLIAINLKNPSAYPSLIQSHVFYGAVLLYILNAYLLNRKVYK